MTTPPPTISTKRRSGAATTRGSRPTPWSAKRPSPVASVTWHGREACSTPPQTDTGTRTFPPAKPGCWRDWPGGRSAQINPTAAVIFAADAVKAAEAIGDPETQLLADSALAAANAIADPTQHNTDHFVALARQRASGSVASLPHRRAGSGGARGSVHTNRDLNQQSRSSRSLRAGHLKPWRWDLSTTSGRPQATEPNLMVMHHDPEQPNARRVQSASSAGPAVEDHGRAVTANIQAAAFYRQAQQAADASDTVTALRHAVTADPAFELAIADLGAFTETASGAISGRQMNWERHHIEVVRTAAAGNLGRAADLLREHLASVGCDPLAVRIVTELRRRAGHRDGLDDLAGHLPRLSSCLTGDAAGPLPCEAWILGSPLIVGQTKAENAANTIGACLVRQAGPARRLPCPIRRGDPSRPCHLLRPPLASCR